MSIRTRPGVLGAVAIIFLVAVHVLVTVVGVVEASRWLGGIAIAIVLVAVTAMHVGGIRRLLRRRRAARERSSEMGEEAAHHHGHGHDSRGHDHGRGHSHNHRLEPSLAASAEGMRAVKISLTVLGATAAAQAVLVMVTASVALLADTIHNIADALTAVPIGVALIIGRRMPNRRYTYGYGRGEDLAGLVVLLAVAASAVIAAYEAMDRLIHPRELTGLGWLVVAGLVGFAGNEWVAAYRIKVGRRIGSAALVADGLHARTDGLTSLAVVLGAGGVALGWPAADPVAGLIISVAILGVLWQAAREVFGRLMDRVDDRTVIDAELAVRGVPGVDSLDRLRMRWVGHELLGEVEISANASLTLPQAHDVAEAVRDELIRRVHRLVHATVHVSPAGLTPAHTPEPEPFRSLPP